MIAKNGAGSTVGAGTVDYRTLETLRRTHPAWRLLTADHAPLIASFLDDTFVRPNIRTLPQPELVTRLDDRLYTLRAELGDGSFPKEALQYLDSWASDEHGWLRKYYPPDDDDAHFDITPATEKAIDWLSSLSQRRFVGAELHLLTVFELLRQLAEGTETDPWARIAKLEQRKEKIEAEMRRIREGEIHLLDATASKNVSYNLLRQRAVSYPIFAKWSRISAISIAMFASALPHGKAERQNCSSRYSAFATASPNPTRERAFTPFGTF